MKRSKVTMYALPHTSSLTYGHEIESTVTKHTTSVPLLYYSEAIGSPTSVKTNPEHASFAEESSPAVYPESYIGKWFCEVEFALTKAALETDKLHAVRMGYMVQKLAFETDYTAKDEISGLEIEDILELQHETTNRTGLPLYTGTDMPVPFTGSTDLHADVTGLTTDQKLESVNFSRDNYYDILQYGKTSKKLQACQKGLKFFVLTRNNPRRKLKIFLDPKVRKVQPYTSFCLLTHAPLVDTAMQIPLSGDTTIDTIAVTVSIRQRFNEWNDSFSAERV